MDRMALARDLFRSLRRVIQKGSPVRDLSRCICWGITYRSQQVSALSSLRTFELRSYITLHYELEPTT